VLPPEFTRSATFTTLPQHCGATIGAHGKNKIGGSADGERDRAFNKEKLHGKKYFTDVIKELAEVPESVKDLLRMSPRGDGNVRGLRRNSSSKDCFRARLGTSASNG